MCNLTVSCNGKREAHYREHIEDWVTALNASFQKKAARNGLSDTNLELRVIGRNAAYAALLEELGVDRWHSICMAQICAAYLAFQ